MQRHTKHDFRVQHSHHLQNAYQVFSKFLWMTYADALQQLHHDKTKIPFDPICGSWFRNSHPVDFNRGKQIDLLEYPTCHQQIMQQTKLYYAIPHIPSHQSRHPHSVLIQQSLFYLFLRLRLCLDMKVGVSWARITDQAREYGKGAGWPGAEAGGFHRKIRECCVITLYSPLRNTLTCFWSILFAITFVWGTQNLKRCQPEKPHLPNTLPLGREDELS